MAADIKLEKKVHAMFHVPLIGGNFYIDFGVDLKGKIMLTKLSQGRQCGCTNVEGYGIRRTALSS